MSDPTIFRPGPDDFSFSFKNIQKGYASVEFMLRAKANIRDALATYKKICDHPDAADVFMPENSAAKLKMTLVELKRAARIWQEDPRNANFQKEYARIVAMAYEDCAKPLGVIDEAANTLKRAIESDEHEGVRIAAGLATQELEQSYSVLNRMRLILKEFSDQLHMVSTHGNLSIGEGSEEGMRKMLGRHIKPPETNVDHEKEALFFAILGILGVEKDNIMKSLGKVQPVSESESLRDAFEQTTRRITDYAKYLIDEPRKAVSLMQADIPRCLEAFEQVKKHMDTPDDGLLDVLIHCIGSLQNDGKSAKR